jgi:hypothetical protein
MARKKNNTNKLISVIEQREKLIEVEKQLRLESLSEFGKLVLDLDNLEPGTGKIMKDAEKIVREQSVVLKKIF